MKIGIVQLNSQLDPKENLKKLESFLAEAKKENAQAVFLPEVF